MRVRGEALELAFRIVLSCPCAVTHEQEKQVFAYLRGLAPDEVADYAPVLAAFDSSDTPFHGLADFTGWMAGAGVEPIIEREHVLRCNASSYHWQLAATTLPAQSRRVSSVSCWLLSHTVIPASLTLAPGAPAGAEYRYEGGSAVFDNVFLPPELEPGASALWAFHLGADREPAERRRGRARLAAQRGQPAARAAPHARRRASTTPTSSCRATTASSAGGAMPRSGAPAPPESAGRSRGGLRGDTPRPRSEPPRYHWRQIAGRRQRPCVGASEGRHTPVRTTSAHREHRRGSCNVGTSEPWSPESWRAFPSAQQPDWPDLDAVDGGPDRS